MSIFRHRLTCFYCGRPAPSRWTKGVTQFHCANCEAVNFLDENGQITDPPVPPTPQEVLRYSSPPPPFIPYEPKYERDEVFCRTCLQNQHIVAESLANYLPPTDDATYSTFESTLPQYKLDLERRYPPVCRDCKPRVDGKLREAHYIAKTDYLRRQAIKTSQGKTQPVLDRTWRDVVLLVAKILWWTNQIVDLVWHLLGILPPSHTKERLRSDSVVAVLACTSHAFWTRTLQPDCYSAMTRFDKTGLILGLASFWWHEKLSEKLHRPSLQVSGYWDYAIVQAVTLAIRSFIWWSLKDTTSSHVWSGVPVSAVHATSVVLTTISTFIATRRVQIKRTPLSSFKNPPPRVDIEEDDSTTPTRKPNLFLSKTHITSTFPISKLASQPPAKNVADEDLDLDLGYASASSASAADDTTTTTTALLRPFQPDVMDWTPAPTTPYTTLTPRRPVPSLDATTTPIVDPIRNPFRGVLPPAPEPPAFKARKQPPAVFKAASEEQKGHFLARVMRRDGASSSAIDGGGGVFGGKAARRAEVEIGEGRLRIGKFGGENETGLEGIFSEGFRIGDGLGEAGGAEGGANGGRVGGVGNEVGSKGFGVWAVGAVLAFVVVILAGANVVSPGFYGSIARGLVSIWRT